jgi:hypothetical protein
MSVAATWAGRQHEDVSTLFRRALALAAIALTVIAVLPASVPSALAGFTCDATHPNNEFRWPIKSLSDADRTSVDFDAIRTTVARLRSFARPSGRVRNSTPRIRPREKHTYSVRASVVKAKLENDGDVILIVGVPNHIGRTIVFEFGNPRCVTDPFKRHRIGRARRAVLRRCGPLDTSFTALHGHMRVRGVGFWDRPSAETGAAPNAFQLWPVLGIWGTCAQT